jgi:hypothetical protein
MRYVPRLIGWTKDIEPVGTRIGMGISVECNTFMPACVHWHLHGCICVPVFVHVAAFYSISNTHHFAHHFSLVFST